MLHRILPTAILWIVLGRSAIGQTVQPDATVGTIVTSSSSVTPAAGAIAGTGQFLVTGGTQQSNALFHSFQDFSPGSATVLFQLSSSQSAVDLVIGRVTGDAASSIDGTLRLSGGSQPALFLLNPNGGNESEAATRGN